MTANRIDGSALRDKRDLGFSGFAGAASLCTRSANLSAVRLIFRLRTFNGTDLPGNQSARSLPPKATDKTWTLLSLH